MPKMKKMPSGNMRKEVKHKRKKLARKKPCHRKVLTRTRDGEVQTRLVTRDPDAPARHDEMGRRPPQRRLGGWTEHRERAMEELHARTLACKKCGLPVDWISARQRVDERWPPQIADGDGCLGQKCGRRNKAQTAASGEPAEEDAEAVHGATHRNAATRGVAGGAGRHRGVGAARGSHGGDAAARTAHAEDRTIMRPLRP